MYYYRAEDMQFNPNRKYCAIATRIKNAQEIDTPYIRCIGTGTCPTDYLSHILNSGCAPKRITLVMALVNDLGILLKDAEVIVDEFLTASACR